MKTVYKLFKGFKLIGEYNSISEAKKNAPKEDGVYNLLGGNYRSSWKILNGVYYGDKEDLYTLGDAVLWLIENGFEVSSGETGRVIRNGIDSDFEVTEYNELSGEPFDNIESAMNYANER